MALPALCADWLPAHSGLLGTDRMRHDVLWMLAHGARTSLVVGLGATALAGITGIFLGGVAGYFGDTGLSLSRAQYVALWGWLPLAWFYALYIRRFEEGSVPEWLTRIGIAGLLCLFLLLCAQLLGRLLPWLRKPVQLPLDRGLRFCMALLHTVPAILLLLALSAVLERSTATLMLLLALTGWTSIARLVRGEMMRMRVLPYIEAARSLGMGEWRVLVRHALPNALAPVRAVLAFGVGHAIMAEGTLSFLGLGVPDEVVTWGRMLAMARTQPDHIALAFWPGAAIFLTVLACNLLGERNE